MTADDITLISPQYGETLWPTMGILRGFADWNVRWDALAPRPSPDFILDIGGGAGAFTLVCKQKWPQAQITILEPSPIVLPYLYRNIGELDGVRILEIAASNVNESAFLSAPIEEELWGQDTLHGNGDRGAMVECQKLDDIIEDHVDIMKIDVEGHERWCLEGAMGILERDHPDLIVEVKKIVRGTKWDPRPILEEIGYVLSIKLGQDFFYGWPR